MEIALSRRRTLRSLGASDESVHLSVQKPRLRLRAASHGGAAAMASAAMVLA